MSQKGAQRIINKGSKKQIKIPKGAQEGFGSDGI